MENVYNKRIRKLVKEELIFDVRATRGNDYFLTVTENRKRFNEDGLRQAQNIPVQRNSTNSLRRSGEAVDYVKTELMPTLISTLSTTSTMTMWKKNAVVSWPADIVAERSGDRCCCSHGGCDSLDNGATERSRQNGNLLGTGNKRDCHTKRSFVCSVCTVNPEKITK